MDSLATSYLFPLMHDACSKTLQASLAVLYSCVDTLCHLTGQDLMYHVYKSVLSERIILALL